MGSSHLYLSADRRILAKLMPDKFDRTQVPVKWLLRDYLEKRCLGQTDARKEYTSLQLLHRAGLKTPRCHGWGLSLAPGNHHPSLLLMEHVQEARPGGDVFDEQDETGRLAFLARFCQEVARLAHVHRDLHLNNLLVDPDGEIVWIDTHVRPLPAKGADQWPALRKSLTAGKLRGEGYRQHAEAPLRRAWEGR